MILILFCTFVLLILCKFHKLALLYSVSVFSSFIVIISLIYDFTTVSRWFDFVKGLSIVFPSVIYCWYLYQYPKQCLSSLWKVFFVWTLRINVFEAVILSLQVMPHTFLLYSNFVFLLFSTYFVPKSQCWFIETFLGSLGFSDIAWVLLNTSSLFMLYCYGQFPFIFASSLILVPLCVCALTVNPDFWIPVRVFSLFSTVFLKSLERILKSFHLVQFGSLNFKNSLIGLVGYSNLGVILFILNCLAFFFLLYDRSKIRKYEMVLTEKAIDVNNIE